MVDPTPIAEADLVVVESTYGNRLDKTLATTYDEFAQVLAATLPRGNVIIPAFVVHGERETAPGFAALIRERLHWPSVEVPQRGDRIRLA